MAKASDIKLVVRLAFPFITFKSASSGLYHISRLNASYDVADNILLPSMSPLAPLNQRFDFKRLRAKFKSLNSEKSDCTTAKGDKNT